MNGSILKIIYSCSMAAMIPTKCYEFPDGYNRTFGTERFRIPELLFNPKTSLRNQKTITTPPTGNVSGEIMKENERDIGNEWIGAHELLLQCVGSCDVDIRPALWNNVILTGGTTLFPSFADRMYNELTGVNPGSKIKIVTPTMIMERKCSGWIGGSILASLGTFQQMWISRQEYEEQGKLIVEKRCP
jgi:actin-like protein 6A